MVGDRGDCGCKGGSRSEQAPPDRQKKNFKGENRRCGSNTVRDHSRDHEEVAANDLCLDTVLFGGIPKYPHMYDCMLKQEARAHCSRPLRLSPCHQSGHNHLAHQGT